MRSGERRSWWFGPNCCPPNITRLLAEVGGLVYANTEDGLWINLYVASHTRTRVRQTPVAVAQETTYPWDGAIRIRLDPENQARFPVRVRIPGWSRNEPMPGGLYRDAAGASQFSLAVNGHAAPHKLEKGHAAIECEWRRGDVIELTLPMSVRRVRADARVADNRGMVALERGPLVYCAEGLDNRGAVFSVLLPDSAPLEYSYRTGTLEGHVRHHRNYGAV